jgi:formylglycine-generating enzyme required for sulfatase activity
MKKKSRFFVCILISIFMLSHHVAKTQGTMSIDLGNSITLEMVWVPGGSFEMGSPDSEEGRFDNEGPVHRVELDSFWMGKYEVTQEQYQTVMGMNPSNFKEAKNPVEQVDCVDAMAFCKKLSDKTGKQYTLPSEAQWEYACRAGSTGRFCFGESDSALGEYAWYNSNSGNMTHPVGKKSPNKFGLYDMHGNVWEWCLDWYDEKFYGKQEANQRNPVNNNSAAERVLRGGSWSFTSRRCRSACREGNFVPAGRLIHGGFRVCRSSSSR